MSEHEAPPTAEVKLALEVKKLQAENLKLDRENSPVGLRLEWLKAAALPATVLTIATTVLVAWLQISDSQSARTAQRFDQAITRLASTDRTTQLAAVTSLREYLGARTAEYRKPTLTLFTIAVSTIEDTGVQSAILDTFRKLPAGEAYDALLDDLLSTALERNRAVTREFLAHEHAAAIAKRNEVAARLLKVAATSLPDSDYLSAELLDKLDWRGKAEILNTAKPFPGYLGNDVASERVRASALLIGLLVERGARSNDFSDIFCPNCRFPERFDGRGVHFDRAMISRSQFINARLQRASFVDADISGVNFDGADLTDADLTVGRLDNSSTPAAVLRYDELVQRNTFPRFTCATLTNADFSGRPLFVLVDSISRPETTGDGTGQTSDLRHEAKLYGQDLRDIGSGRPHPIEVIGLVYVVTENDAVALAETKEVQRLLIGPGGVNGRSTNAFGPFHQPYLYRIENPAFSGRIADQMNVTKLSTLQQLRVADLARYLRFEAPGMFRKFLGYGPWQPLALPTLPAELRPEKQESPPADCHAAQTDGHFPPNMGWLKSSVDVPKPQSSAP